LPIGSGVTPRRILALVSIVICAIFPTSAHAQITVQRVADGLSAPLGFVQIPSDPTAQVILEQAGRVRLLKDGVLREQDFLDLTGVVLSGGENGLLGVAFSPAYATDHRVFVNFVDSAGRTVVARFVSAPDDLLHADPSTRFDLMWPGGERAISRRADHHFGGDMAFGPDGYLYIGLGDGDDGNDPAHDAQNPTLLLGKMLRIDVAVSDDDPEGYDVPAGNPFAGREGVLGEIWAIGLRNPWRWSFDNPALGGTGALLIGDVGQDAWEEIDYQPAGSGGRNYGWRNREGANDNVTDLPPFSEPLIDPVFQYSHEQGRSVTGGMVYRGQALGAEYRGRYFFGDFTASAVWSIGLAVDPDSGEAVATDFQAHDGLSAGATGLASFGVDAAGELYLVSYLTGDVYRVVRAAQPPPPNGCTTPDPFVALGGGRCVAGGWLPPDASPPPAPLGGDFNGDGGLDLVWENVNGQVYAWFMNGLSLTGGAYLSPDSTDPEWTVVGTSDLTGDGKPDLLWQHQQTGQVEIFAMDGAAKIGDQMIGMAPNTPWRIAGTGDFNNDGKADIIWQNVSAGTMYIWFMASANGVASFQNGSYVQDGNGQAISLGPDSPWRIVGTGDVNGDGKVDLIWQDTASGFLAAWYLSGATTLQGVDLSPNRVSDTTWRLRAVGDYNGDGYADLIWHNTATGDLYAWFLNGVARIGEEPLTPSRVNLAWTVVGPK